MTMLSPDQTAVLQAAMQRAAQLREALALADNHVQAVIIGITGESGTYNLVNNDGPWRLEKGEEDTLGELNRLIESGEGVE